MITEIQYICLLQGSSWQSHVRDSSHTHTVIYHGFLFLFFFFFFLLFTHTILYAYHNDSVQCGVEEYYGYYCWVKLGWVEFGGVTNTKFFLFFCFVLILLRLLLLDFRTISSLLLFTLFTFLNFSSRIFFLFATFFFFLVDCWLLVVVKLW